MYLEHAKSSVRTSHYPSSIPPPSNKRLKNHYVGYAQHNLPTYICFQLIFHRYILSPGRDDKTYNIERTAIHPAIHPAIHSAIHPASMAALHNLSTDSLLNHMTKHPQKHGVSADGTIAKTSTASSRPISVLFVCLGNICRSPMADAVFRSLTASDQRLGQIDSCGTGAYRTYATDDSGFGLAGSVLTVKSSQTRATLQTRGL